MLNGNNFTLFPIIHIDDGANYRQDNRQEKVGDSADRANDRQNGRSDRINKRYVCVNS